MRVQVRWAEERVGAITDIACVRAARRDRRTRDGTSDRPRPDRAEPVTGIITPVELDYLYAASPEESAFFRGLAEGKLVGQRCPTCQQGLRPAAQRLPRRRRRPTTDEVELADTGT